MTEFEWLASTDPVAMLAWLENTRVARGSISHSYNHATQKYDIGPSSRQLRLVACACCRSAWHRFDTNAKQCVQSAENVADGLCRPLLDDGSNILSRVLDVAALDAGDRFVSESHRRVSAAASCCHWDHNNRHASLANLLVHAEWLGVTRGAQANILRDIVGNPFRPVVLPPGEPATCPRCEGDGWVTVDDGWGARNKCKVCIGKGKLNLFAPCPWLTPLVLSLATAAYEDRLPDGTLDPQVLAVLSDALEDAGCPTHEEIQCPVCSAHKDDPENPWRAAGYHPERDPASGRHEGGWTNCKTCNSGGEGYVRAGVVRSLHLLLAHLRSPGPHWRGCWAVNLLLGKE